MVEAVRPIDEARKKSDDVAIRAASEYAEALREATGPINALAARIESDWFSMSDQDQNSFIDWSRRYVEAEEAGRDPRSFIETVEHLVSPDIYRVFETDVENYRRAERRLRRALASAVLEEDRRLKVAEESIEADPEALAAIELGEREYNTRRSKRMTQEEFLGRFSSI